MFRKKKDSKYSNESSLCALNHSHRSKLEGSVCQIIQLREEAGELKLVQIEDTVLLCAAKIRYIPDFKCSLPDGSTLHIEAKGYSTPEWNLKKRLWKHYGPNPLEIWGGHHSRPSLLETIVPVAHE